MRIKEEIRKSELVHVLQLEFLKISRIENNFKLSNSRVVLDKKSYIDHFFLKVPLCKSIVLSKSSFKFFSPN